MKEKAMHSFTALNSEFFHEEISGRENPIIIWGHGWGQNHAAFMPLAQSLARLGHHLVLDFPGFGRSPRPTANWSTADYADAIAAYLKECKAEPIIWVGHSFGGRVGVQLASRHPDLIKGLILIAGAGLQRKRPLFKKLYFKARVTLYKTLKKLIPLGLSQSWLQSKFGSRDYQSAGEMRDIFLNVIREDLTSQAQSISCPTLLIYGAQDTETPPEFGQRYNALIKNSTLHILEGNDHYTVLSSGRHQVANLIQGFITQYA